MSDNNLTVICKDSTYDVMLHHAAHIPWDGTWRVTFEKIEPEEKHGTRTLTQNAAMHKYFDLLAEALNDAGYSVQTVITAPVSFTRDTVKEYLWRRIQTAMYPEIISTKDLNKLQVSDVYENLNRVTGEKFGVSIPFPKENINIKQLYKVE